MIFVSRILGARVKDNAEEYCGIVTDLLIEDAKEKEFPKILGIIVKNKKTESFIPTKTIESWGPEEVDLDDMFQDVAKPAQQEFQKKDNIISLHRTVLDKQIVDLTGMRVVRVNDLQIGRVKDEMCLIAIDISTRGILRRLGLSNDSLDKVFKPHLLEWKNIQMVDNKIHLSQGVKELVKLHPADIANIIEKMNVHQGSSILESLDQSVAARVLEEIEPDIQKVLVKKLGTERTASLMNKMSVDELVDLIQLLPPHESREILKKLPVDTKKEKIKMILEYDEDTAGGLMTTEYIVALPWDTAEEVTEKIRKNSHLHHSVLFIYVVDKSNHFMGVVSIRNLLVADKTEKMKDLMKKFKKVPNIHVDQDITSVAAHMTKYNLLSAAVTDRRKRLLGVVTVDDIMRHFVPKA